MKFPGCGTLFPLLLVLVHFASGHPANPQKGVLPAKPQGLPDIKPEGVLPAKPQAVPYEVPILKPRSSDGCPAVVWENETAGHIYSPNYPNSYPPSADCYYKIQGIIGSKVALVFYVFEMELKFDFVTLYDGDGPDEDPDAVEIVTLTGNNTANSVYRTNQSSTMTIHFSSDEYDNELGFFANFIIANDIREDPTGVFCPNNLYKDDLGVIVSPHYPGQYPGDADCGYSIEAKDQNSYIVFTINSFVTEGQYDYLNIYDGRDNSSSLLIQLTGSIFEGASYTTSGPYAYARFVSDTYNNEAGFSITYQTMPRDVTTPIVPIQIFNKVL
ncbi:hypothetical protein FO519_008155 [Halicephalobus sp. NKZ332]|nr:hypothetical protein FO519_008155 [Halicephalobus sp. NKZ332]